MSTGLKANSDGSAAIQVGGTDVITLTSGGAATFVTSPTTLAGNLTFSGTGNRITGDFSNATVANRVMFQTSTVNGLTSLDAMPNGTSQISVFNLWNSSDPINAARMQVGALSTEARLLTDKTGTGTFLPMTFYTGGTESMRLSATSKALILAGGDTTANGTGITFPATQSASSNANTLDDYEEGTWSPSIGGTATYTTQLGRYTKIGRVVIATFTLKINVRGTGSVYTINNLPFQSEATVTHWGFVGNYTSSTTTVYSLYAYIDPSSTNCSFGGSTSLSGTSAVPINIWQNGTEVNATVVYIAA